MYIKVTKLKKKVIFNNEEPNARTKIFNINIYGNLQVY